MSRTIFEYTVHMQAFQVQAAFTSIHTIITISGWGLLYRTYDKRAIEPYLQRIFLIIWEFKRDVIFHVQIPLVVIIPSHALFYRIKRCPLTSSPGRSCQLGLHRHRWLGRTTFGGFLWRWIWIWGPVCGVLGVRFCWCGNGDKKEKWVLIYKHSFPTYLRRFIWIISHYFVPSTMIQDYTYSSMFDTQIGQTNFPEVLIKESIEWVLSSVPRELVCSISRWKIRSVCFIILHCDFGEEVDENTTFQMK